MFIVNSALKMILAFPYLSGSVKPGVHWAE